jgi:hypothetical protein
MVLWAERLKLKRSKILWIAVFSAIMVAFIVFMQGQFQYYGQRYVEDIQTAFNFVPFFTLHKRLRTHGNREGSVADLCRADGSHDH